MRSKRSKKWHINSETRKARRLIEQGTPALLPAPFVDTGRYVPPHRSGSGGIIIDELGSFNSVRFVKRP